MQNSRIKETHPFVIEKDFCLPDYFKDPEEDRDSFTINLCKSLSELELTIIVMIRLVEKRMSFTFSFEQVYEEYRKRIPEIDINYPIIERPIIEKTFLRLSEIGVIEFVDSRERVQRRCKMTLLPEQVAQIPSLCENCPAILLQWIKKQVENS